MIRADRNGIEYTTSLKFATPFSYVTHDPKEAIGGKDYFLPLRNMLQVGDEIRVSCRKGSGWSKSVWEVISSIEDKTKTKPAEVTVHQISKWRHGGPEESKG